MLLPLQTAVFQEDLTVKTKEYAKERVTKMIKTVVKIEGMMCGMCEAHMNDAIRNNFTVKKVTSSHSKCETEIISENELDEAKLRETVEKTGYKFLGITTEPYEKKGFSLFGKK